MRPSYLRAIVRTLSLSIPLAILFVLPSVGLNPASAAPRYTPGVIDPPDVTLDVPPTAFLGTSLTFGVTFDNNDPEGEVGYGPFIDLEIPRTGADGAGAATDDGLGTSTVAASYLGRPIPAQDLFLLTFSPTGTASHPLMRNAAGNFVTVSGTPGDLLFVIRLPFGSFTAAQPPARVDVTVDVSNLADVGTPLAIRARGGYMFGYDPLDNWCCGDAPDNTFSAFTSGSVTPTLFALSKTYAGPSNTSAETATGPNYQRRYTLSVDVAPGQTISDLRLTDLLPANEEYASLVSATPAGYTLDSQPAAGGAQNPPDNALTVHWASVTGGAGTSDAAAVFSFFIPRDDADGLPVLNPATGAAATSCNDGLVSGTWTPLDARDATQTVTIDPPGCEHTLADRSLAIQKTAVNLTDGVNSPGDVMEYSVEIQVSDFFAFDQLVLTDVVSDGQHFDSSFAPTLAVAGNGYALPAAVFQGANYTVDESNIDLTDGPPAPPPESLATNGTTILTFRLSDEIVSRGQNGRMVGGCVDPVGGSPAPDCTYNDGATTAEVRFRTIIQHNFTDVYPSGDWSVDQGDLLDDHASISGRVLDTGDFTPGATVTDDAAASFSIPTGTLTKTIFAVNGSTSFSSPVRIKPGDTVTYRIVYLLPTSDEENLAFNDYLPLPVFYVGDPDANDYDTLPPAGRHNDGPGWAFDAVGQSGQPSVVPAAGHANFGPTDTFHDYSGIVPALDASAADNRLGFTYGDFDDPRDQPTTVDILFTVTVATEPFADRLYLTNQAHAVEGSTNAGEVGSDEIVQLILTEPALTSTKAVLWSSNPSNVFTPAARGPAGVTFLAPGAAPRWTGTINANGLAANPINSDVRDVDAGDTVTFAITVQNNGTSLKGAFDLQLRDTLQPQYQIPSGGLNLQVYYGNGTGPIPYRGLTSACTASGNNDPCGEDLFQDGIELIDPVGQGVCQAHDPNLGNDIILITYDLQIRTGVAPGDVVNTETLIHYAGEEGGPNYVPVPSPLTDQATATISGAPVKYIVATSEASTGFSGLEQAAIGEIVRYRIVARVPESTIADFQLRDLLPNGLIFLDDGTARIGFVSNNGIASAARDSVPAIPFGCNLVGAAADAVTPASLPCLLDDWNIGSTNSTTADPDSFTGGTDVYFKLGDITNSDLDDDGEYAVIEFNALVHNQTVNQNDSGAIYSNAVREYAGTPLLPVGRDSPGVRIQIVEPFLTLAKTDSTGGTPVDAGDPVTFTVTFTNDGNPPVNSTATAFDINFTDLVPAADLTLDLSSVAFTATGGAAGIVNASSGNTVQLVIGSMPVGSRVVVTYQATVTTAVTPGQAIANAAELTWTSLPGPRGTGDQTPGPSGSDTGERNGSNGPTGNPNDYDRRAVDTLTVRAPVFSKSLLGTSAAHTAGDALAIGERATFGLFVTLPEGTTPALQVTDDIPAGMAYVPGSLNLVTQTSPPAACGNLPANFAGTVPMPTLTISPPGGSGADLTFDFGAVTVTDDNISGDNTFLICYDAILLNEAGNQAGSPALANLAVLTVGLQTFTASHSVTIVEPVLRITKTVDDSHPAPGQTLTFTVTVDHAPASNAEAFDVEIYDSLPAGLTLDLASVSFAASGGLVGTFNGSAGNLLFVSVTEFPQGGSLTITYQASVSAAFGASINNVANVTWSSLPGLDADERSGTDGVGGALNDYAAASATPLVADRNLTKTLVGDNFPAPVTTLPDVTIGEMLTYELVLTVPPGSSDVYSLTDTLDPGLAFADCEEITAGADLTSSAVALNVPGNCNPGIGGGFNPQIAGSGTMAVYDFGTVANSGSAPESVTIRYRAVVLDVSANASGATLANRAVLQWSLGSIARATAPVRIIEPELALEKTVDRPGAVPGMVLTYRVRIYHTPGSQLPAYDAVVNDVLPADVVYVPGSLHFVAGSGTAPDALDDTGIDPGTGRLVMHAAWNILPLGSEAAIEFQVTFGAVTPGTVISNTAAAEWTSLPGAVPAPPATYLSAFNQPYSHERRYDPVFPADAYRVTSTAAVTAFSVPDTGFAPGQTTALPAQPAAKRYADLGAMQLQIPKLGQTMPVVGVPIGASGWDLTWLYDQAGYLEGTSFPGSAGNSVITAHVYLPSGLPGPFVGLGTLGWGDSILLSYGGQRFVYQVREVLRVPPTDLTPFRHEEESWLTLITCQGYNGYSNTYRYRTVVRAVLIAVE